MIRKVTLLLAVASFVMATSCKDGEMKPEASGETVNAPSVHGETATPPPPPANGKYPIMTFAETQHDFGTITSGDKVEHNFKFTNTGESDLIITKAVGSCGCTVPEFPKDPIKPGQSADMKVSFNSANKHGQQTKTVTITTNTATGQETLTIKASIKEGSAIANTSN